MRTLFAALLTAAFAAPAVAQDKPKGEKIELTTFSGHYEKMDSGLTGIVSLVLLTDADGFEKVFGTVPPSGITGKNPGVKIESAKKATFDTTVVAGVIRRGNALISYSNPVAYLDGDTVTITYKAELGKQTTAKVASTMVLGVPKDKVKKIVFIENGKELGTAK